MARYLLLGHLTRDLLPEGGFRYGGAVLYAGLTARRLGFEVGVVTASAERDLSAVFPELRFYHLPSPQTTTFENLLTPSGRRQRVHAQARPISIKDLPPAWRRAEIIHLAPVLDEISPAEARLLETDFLVANPQGWFRQVRPDGEVVFKQPDLSQAPRFKALVLSEEDLQGHQELIPQLRQKADLLVLTMGRKGASLWEGDEHFFLPVEPQPERDATGAGDIFAAAFFAMLFASGKPKVALRFAACLASVSVLRAGLASVPSLEEISNCLERP